jgi:hypothetical protein
MRGKKRKGKTGKGEVEKKGKGRRQDPLKQHFKPAESEFLWYRVSLGLLTP